MTVFSNPLNFPEGTHTCGQNSAHFRLPCPAVDCSFYFFFVFICLQIVPWYSHRIPMKFPQFPSSVIWWFPEIGVPPDHPNFNGIFFYKLSLWGYPHDYGNLHHSQNSHDNQPTLPMRCRFFSRGTTSTAMPATAVRRWRLVSRLPQAPGHDASRRVTTLEGHIAMKCD